MVCSITDSDLDGVPLYLSRLAGLHWTSSDDSHDTTQYGHCYHQQKVPGETSSDLRIPYSCEQGQLIEPQAERGHV